MRITLTDEDGERPMNGEIDDRNWVAASLDAAWAYARRTGADSITVRSNDALVSDDGSYRRICTVAITLHED